MVDAAPYVPPPSPARALAFSAIFGAAALLLPTLFHLVTLGPAFLPMYLPLVTLAFLVPPRSALGTALLVPLLSALLTGMPPLFPPIALLMSLELGTMAGLMAWARRRAPALPTLAILVPGLLLGRALHLGLAWGLAWGLARWLDLPASFLAGLSVLAGWPGLVLMAVVIPSLLPRLDRRPRPT